MICAQDNEHQRAASDRVNITRNICCRCRWKWRPQWHVARFAAEVVDQRDPSAIVKAWRGSGSASYRPVMLLGLLIRGYTTKVFSNRLIDGTKYDPAAFRCITGNEHPGPDAIARFRKRVLP